MKQNCLETIRSIYSKLNETEKKIADYILQYPDTVIHQTINEVAAHVNLSDATIFRFSKRLGFKGFQAMKIALASEIMSAEPNKPSLKQNKGQTNLTASVFLAAVAALEHTYEQLDQAALAKAASIIASANRTQFFGTGASSLLALDAFVRFSQAGIRAAAFPETHLQLLTAAQLTGQDTAVVISQSGNSPDTLAILDILQGTGAAIITLTGSAQTPVSMYAEVPLVSAAARMDETGSLAVRTAQLVLLDALYICTRSLTQPAIPSEKRPHPSE